MFCDGVWVAMATCWCMERFSSLEVAIDGVEWLCSKGYIYLVLRDRGNTFLKELWVRILRDESLVWSSEVV